MDGKKIFKSDNKIYFWIIGFFDFLLFLYEPIIAGLGLILLGYLLFYNWKLNKKRDRRWQNYIESLSSDIDSAAKYAILNLPFPLTLIDFDGNIKWYNSKFTDMVDKDNIIDENIEKIVTEINIDDFIYSNEEEIVVKKNGKHFRVYNNIVRLNNSKDDGIDYIVMLYWVDISEKRNLEVLLEDKSPIIAAIQIDNYDEVVKGINSVEKPIIVSSIQKEINLWASRINGYIQRIQTDKYFVIFEKKYLNNLEAKKFGILDKIRDINQEGSINPTLSMGVATQGKDFLELGKSANAALELSLARGGDQVSVYKKDEYEFYGGKSKVVEKKNRVKARIISHGFIPIIDESSNVIIMGHQNPDMDCYGAAIGMYRGIIDRGLKAYILLNEESEGIEEIHQRFKSNEDYKFINNEEANDLIKESTLLVIVDTHRPSFTENPDLLKKVNRKVLVDHHRRGTEFIENPLITYQEPYASSTCELVTEMLQYLNDEVRIEKIEAEALLAGIYVDTKSFSFKTGVRTFEAASFLRRYGADTLEIKQLFQDDLKNYIDKSNIVNKAKIFYDEIAISILPEEIGDKSPSILAAQGADELLKIKGIEASFVIGKKENEEIFISGRSLGKISVQLILEKLGGGGHMTVAGAQFVEMSIDEVKNKLKEGIDNYMNKEEE